MAVHTEYRPAIGMGPIERALRALIVIVVCIAFATAAAFGGFEYGRRSRPSDPDIAAQRADAVHAAVTRAVAAKGRSDHVKRLRIIRPEARALYISGYSPAVIARHGLADASVPLLQKPFTPETVGRTIRQVLATPGQTTT